MKKAKIYIPSKTAMQSGRGKLKKWVLEFETKDPSINPLMGWETSTDTLEEVILKFSTKKQACFFVENLRITSSNVSVDVSQPIRGFIEGSLVSNSKTHFFNLPLPDCIAVLEGM